MAGEGTTTKSNGTVITLSIACAVLFLGVMYAGYEAYSMNVEIRELHDNLNTLAKNGGTVPQNLIPADLLARMDKMKTAA